MYGLRLKICSDRSSVPFSCPVQPSKQVEGKQFYVLFLKTVCISSTHSHCSQLITGSLKIQGKRPQALLPEPGVPELKLFYPRPGSQMMTQRLFMNKCLGHKLGLFPNYLTTHMNPFILFYVATWLISYLLLIRLGDGTWLSPKAPLSAYVPPPNPASGSLAIRFY